MFANTNNLVPDFYLVLKQMEESKFDFYLTGSRFFGGERPDSDYDFFVCLDHEVEFYLHKLGFKTDTVKRYLDDPTFVDVLCFETGYGVIQVQLIKSEMFAKKKLAQQLLFDQYYGMGLPGDKSFKREFWRLAYHCIDKCKVA